MLRKHALLPSVIEACSSEDEIIDKLLALKVLRLPAKGITKMDGLDVVNNLVRLHLQRNRIQQIDGLEFLRGLTWLDLSQNEVRVVQKLRHLVNLRYLNLSRNRIECLTGEAQFPRGLEVLKPYGNPLSEGENYRGRVCEMLPRLTFLMALLSFAAKIQKEMALRKPEMMILM